MEVIVVTIFVFLVIVVVITGLIILVDILFIIQAGACSSASSCRQTADIQFDHERESERTATERRASVR